MALQVNIGSDKGFLPEGTKPLPKPILTYDEIDSYKPLSMKFWMKFKKKEY